MCECRRVRAQGDTASPEGRALMGVVPGGLAVRSIDTAARRNHLLHVVYASNLPAVVTCRQAISATPATSRLHPCIVGTLTAQPWHGVSRIPARVWPAVARSRSSVVPATVTVLLAPVAVAVVPAAVLLWRAAACSGVAAVCGAAHTCARHHLARGEGYSSTKSPGSILGIPYGHDLRLRALLGTRVQGIPGRRRSAS